MTRRRGTPVGAIAAALLATSAAGCDRSPDTPPGTVARRDSAGVAIVESSGAAWSDAEGWTVDPAPQVVIGDADGDAPYLLDRVVGATRLPDGRIVVADGGSNQLRFYDARGTYLRAAGGSGGGPGEFEHLRALRRCGADSLFAFDLHWQLTVFTADGRPARDLDVALPGGATTPYALACSPTGRVAVAGWGDAAQRVGRIGLFRATSTVWTLDADGAATGDLGAHLASERIGHRRGSIPHPFGRAVRIAATTDAVFLGSGERFEIRRHALDGRLTHLWRAPSESLAITPAMIDAYRAFVLERVDPAQRPLAARELREMPMPDGVPAFTRLEVDATGHVWAERFRVAGDTSAVRWAVFSPDGALLGHVRLPGRFDLHEIGADHVLGTATDDEGVERVRLHALRRTR